MPEMQSPNRKVNKQAATSPRSASSSMIRDMTEGPVASQLLRFALPLFVSNALQAVYKPGCQPSPSAGTYCIC